jgi:hypothetical protein
VKRTHAARYALGAMALAEGLGAVLRHRERAAVLRAATDRARAIGRPLAIVSAPETDAHAPPVQLLDCAPSGALPEAGSACRGLARGDAPIADRSVVVFAPCVLEYTADPESVWREFVRMAGSPAEVYLVTVQPWTAASVYVPGARWIVVPRAGVHAPPEFVPVTTLRTAAWSAALAAVGTAAVLPERAGRGAPEDDTEEGDDADPSNGE